VQKAIQEVQNKNAETVVMLLPNRSSTKWANLCFKHAKEVRLLRPRVQFLPPKGLKQSSNNSDSMAVIFTRRPRSQKTAKVTHWNWK
jgi:hypothetical protein